MTTIRDYTFLNFFALQFAADPKAAVSPDAIAAHAEKGTLIEKVIETAKASGVDASIFESRVATDFYQNLNDALGSAANAYESGLEYDGDHGWIALSTWINQTLQDQVGNVEVTW